MEGKNECPICNEVVSDNNMNCYECMTCKQHIHGLCLIQWNHTRKPLNRFLRDDILPCPICRGDSVAYCNDPTVDINADIKAAILANPNRRGGKRRSIKLKRVKRLTKTKRVKKSKRSRK